MVADPSSVAGLVNAIPDFVIQVLDPHARASSEHLREALGNALAAAIFVLCLHLVTTVLLWISNLLNGRSLVVRPTGFFSFVRKLSLIGVVALPTYQVLEVLEGGGGDSGNAGMAFLCGLIWVCLRAAVRDKVWLDASDRKVCVRSGFAVFTVTNVTIDLSQTLLDSTSRAPVGMELTGRQVYVAKPAIDVLSKHLGGKDSATQWLRTAVGAIGLVPAGTHFVAGN